MESRLPHTNDEQEVPISQHTGHHDQNEDDHHGEEKKSVFRRFKDKARKIKNTITKHGQGQDHEYVDDDNEEEEDEEEDDETAEVHGAPKYDSALGGPDAIVAQPKDNLERPSVIADTKPVASHVPPLTVPAGGAYGTNMSGQSELGGQDVNPEKGERKIRQPTGMENEVTFDPSPTREPTPVTEHTYGTENAFDSFENRGQDGTHGELKSSSTGKSTGMMEVPHAPSGLGSGTDPANYQTKFTNPTHTEGKEAGLSQVQHSFDKMGIQDSGSEHPEDPENLPHDTIAGNQSTALSGLGSGTDPDPANYETKVTNPTHTEGKEAGLSQVQHSFDKRGIQDSGSERPEHPENLPYDTLAGNQSTALSGLGSGTDPENYETKDANPTHTEGKEAGLSQVQHSFDKTGIQDSGSERPEHPDNLPYDTLAGNQATALSGLGSGTDPVNYETKDANPTYPGGKEAGLSQLQHSFDKTGIQDSGSERPEYPENLPHDTLAGNESTALSGLGSGTDPANYETKVTNSTHTEAKEAGLSQVQHSFDKTGIQDSGSERPELPENLPYDTLAGNESTDLSGLGSGTDSANDETEVTNPTHTDTKKINHEITRDKEARLSQVQHSFDKMGIQDSGSERPEHPENLPHDTLAGNQITALSGLGSGTDPENYETKDANPTYPGDKEAGLSQVQHSFDKMGIQDSGSERPEYPENLPHDTLEGNQSTALSGLGSGSGTDPENYETKVTSPTHTGGDKEAGLSQVQHSFDKTDIHNSGTERKRFDPEHPDNLPPNTLAGNQSTPNSSYTEKISSMASAIASKFGYSGEQPTTTESDEKVKNSGSTATDYAHSITDKVTETSAPINEKVVDAGTQ